jgi:hypothetical protein
VVYDSIEAVVELDNLLLAVEMHLDVLTGARKHGRTMDGEEIFRASLEICLVDNDMIVITLVKRFVW